MKYLEQANPDRPESLSVVSMRSNEKVLKRAVVMAAPFCKHTKANDLYTFKG